MLFHLCLWVLQTFFEKDIVPKERFAYFCVIIVEGDELQATSDKCLKEKITMNIREFETWVRRLRPSLLNTARRMLGDEEDAEDTVQDALLKLWLIRDRLTLYRSPEALATAVVKNLSISLLRERTNNPTPLPEDLEIRSERTPEREMEEREDHVWLARIIHGLPSAQMTILKMSQSEGMSNQQIADVLGIAETSVRTAICKARHKLLEELKKRR